MTPSSRSGRARVASAVRLHSVCTSALLLVLACSRGGPAGHGAGDTTVAGSAAPKDAREGGTGARAKGDEATLGAPAKMPEQADATGDRRELVALIQRAEQLQAGEPATRAN